jgi:hypothetical protein
VISPLSDSPPATPKITPRWKVATSHVEVPQLPPNKSQIGVVGPILTRDGAQDEAIEKRRANERVEELAREEAGRSPLGYATNAMYKAVRRKGREPPSLTSPEVAAIPQIPVGAGVHSQYFLKSKEDPHRTSAKIFAARR